MDQKSKIYLAGHTGLVGSAILRRLQSGNYSNIITHTHSELDLTNQQAVREFFKEEQPEYVFLAAARVGGIRANDSMPAEFINQNLQIQTNVIDSAHRYGVSKLLFLGSSCIYPRECPQPMKEEYLLSGPLESTNQWYAIAKIAGIKMCQAYHKQYGFNAISVMPTNLYGPNDNFDLETSHVLPAMIRKFHDAKQSGNHEVVLWGTGSPKREFLHVNDLADACLFLMNNYDESDIINVGMGKDITIKELSTLIMKIIAYKGEIVWNNAIPDGTPRKLLDINKLTSLGWEAKIKLETGIQEVYMQYQVEHVSENDIA